MTERLLTVALNLNSNKQSKVQISLQNHESRTRLSTIIESLNNEEHIDLHVYTKVPYKLVKHRWLIWPRGYKTFFMLNSAEHEIYFAYKS